MARGGAAFAGVRYAAAHGHMSTETNGRAQDQARPHTRKRRPTVADVTLIESYRDALRSEIRSCLAELRPIRTGQQTIDGTADTKRPNLEKRGALIRLMALCVKELGTDVDEPANGSGADAPTPSAGTAGRRGRIAF